MIFVSGTKRSGTSMWMQILAAAGFPVLGKAFPRGWDKTALRDANPDGFYESLLRQGVYYRTNPHPKTGKYFLPEDVDGYAVKVFIPGVVRSERAYITRLVANVRAWREYEASILRLYSLEDAERREKRPDAPAPVRFPPAYEWWMENFALIRDISLRRYPARLFAYDDLIARPGEVLPGTLAWLGAGREVDVARALAAVKPERRTQEGARAGEEARAGLYDDETARPIDAATATIFDDLHAEVASRGGVSRTLLQALNRTNRELLPRLVTMQRRVAQDEMRRRRPRRGPMGIEGLPPVGRDNTVMLGARPVEPTEP